MKRTSKIPPAKVDQGFAFLLVAYCVTPHGTESFLAIDARLRVRCIRQIEERSNVVPNLSLLKLLDGERAAAQAFARQALNNLTGAGIVRGEHNGHVYSLKDMGMADKLGMGTHPTFEGNETPINDMTLIQLLEQVEGIMQGVESLVPARAISVG